MILIAINVIIWALWSATADVDDYPIRYKAACIEDTDRAA